MKVSLKQTTFGSFFPVIKETRDSSTEKRIGRMSKEGASTARWALSIALDTITLRNKPLKEYYNSVKNRKGSGNYAHVAMMRKLIRMTFTMLNERKEKRYENTVLTEGKLSRPDDD